MAENRRETGARKLPAAQPTGKARPGEARRDGDVDTAHGPFGAELDPEDDGRRHRRGRPEDGLPPSDR